LLIVINRPPELVKAVFMEGLGLVLDIKWER